MTLYILYKLLFLHVSKNHQMKNFFLIILILYNLSISGQIHTDKYMEDANTVAIEWLHNINNGEYKIAYQLLTSKAKNQFEEEIWITLIKDLMKDFGDLNSRKVTEIYFQNEVEGLEDGFYVFINYECDYERTQEHTESIVLKQNDQTKWEISDYFNWFKEKGDK